MSIVTKYLSEFQRAEIARSLFTVTNDKEAEKGELHGLCPIHNESNPSFSYNYKKNSYNCLSCGAHGDLIGLFCEVNHYNQQDGFKIFCEQHNIPLEKKQDSRDRSPNDPSNAVELSHEQIVAMMNTAWEKFPPLPMSKIADLEKKRGWDRKWIEILDLRLETWRLSKREIYIR